MEYIILRDNEQVIASFNDYADALKHLQDCKKKPGNNFLTSYKLYRIVNNYYTQK